MRSFLLATWTLVAAAGVASLPTGEPGAQRRPDVILITLDTDRADRMGFLGSTCGLDTVARRLRPYRHRLRARLCAGADVTPTVSHATLLTGPIRRSITSTTLGAPLPALIAYLPVSPEGAGISHRRLRRIAGPRSENGTAPGFDRGFDVYDARFRLRQPGGRSLSHRRASRRRGHRTGARLARGRARRIRRAARPASCGSISSTPTHPGYDPPGDLAQQLREGPVPTARSPSSISAGRPAALRRRQTDTADRDRQRPRRGARRSWGIDALGVFLCTDATLRVPLIVRAREVRGRNPR